MKIFLTGATGFIGSHFVNQALEAGHTVLGLRRGPTSQPRIPLLQDPLWLDKSMEKVESADFAGYDILVHLAAHSANVPYDNLLNCLNWNLMAPMHLFDQARIAGIDKFLVAGSCFEYGTSGENCSFITVDAPLQPTQTYPASKAAASIVFLQWARQYQLSLHLMRIFQVFGEGEAEGRLWPSLRRAALAGEDFPMTDGEQIRDFINVVDVARAFVAEAESLMDVKGNVLLKNIGSGHPQTIRAFSEKWWDTWQASGKLLIGALPYREGEVMRYVPEI
jgi:nucleoside-diphosphate-sugar epimerase